MVLGLFLPRIFVYQLVVGVQGIQGVSFIWIAGDLVLPAFPPRSLTTCMQAIFDNDELVIKQEIFQISKVPSHHIPCDLLNIIEKNEYWRWGGWVVVSAER